MAFIDLMKEKAKQDVMTIILPESNDKRTLIAAAQVLKEKTADLIMIGKEENPERILSQRFTKSCTPCLLIPCSSAISLRDMSLNTTSSYTRRWCSVCGRYGRRNDVR